MFQVGRYDPKNDSSTKANRRGEGANQPKKKKRRKGQKREGGEGGDNDDDDDDVPKSSSLRVIAPDETNNSKASKMNPAVNEALDEYDLPMIDFDSTALVDDDHAMIEKDEEQEQETERTRTAAETDQAQGQDNDVNTIQQKMSVGQASHREIRAALKAASLPLRDAAKVWKLAPFLLDNLRRDGFEHFFPIQALSIPDVIASERHFHVRAQDVCITAPTGSGKTLSFVLPVLNALADRQVRRLRALVVLPSRDLANQVYRVFESYVKGSDLKVGLAIGQSDFTAEQVALTVGEDGEHADDNNESTLALQRLRFDPGNLGLALRAYRDSDYPAGRSPASSNTNGSSIRSNRNRTPCKALQGGRSAIDILVCTPGRLVDHLDNTDGFTLQHLRFLVVDEADRLLNQSYHGWIGRVIDAANQASVEAWHAIAARGDNRLPPAIPENKSGISWQERQEPITWRRGGTAGDDSDFDTNNSYLCPASLACRPVQLRKFLVSATLTRDPQKMAALRLVNPKHFDVHQLNMSSGLAGSSSINDKSNQRQKFAVPTELEEFIVECTAEQKPIVLLSLLIEQLQKSEEHSRSARKGRNVIVVFTASVDSTHRLARLLQLIRPSCGEVPGVGEGTTSGAVVEFSSALSQAERSSLIQRCNYMRQDDNKSGDDDISIVVCSDSMARGMDIDKCGTVINYDVPTLAKTYLHRVGRTARAGKSGVAISLLKSGQMATFNRMRRLIQSPNNNKSSVNGSLVPTMDITKTLVRHLVPIYRNCIRGLKDVLEAEENGELKHTETLSEEYFEAHE